MGLGTFARREYFDNSLGELAGLRLNLPAYAKINFTLEVFGRRSDGFHEVSTVLQSISLADRIEIELGGEGTRVSVSGAGVPSGPENLTWRAVEALRERTGFRGGVHVHLVKNIPVASGLGGGSSDAAAVLVGLNSLAGLDLAPGELLQIAAGLGSDVPFTLAGATALARGRGEELTWLPSPPPMWLVLAMPAKNGGQRQEVGGQRETVGGQRQEVGGQLGSSAGLIPGREEGDTGPVPLQVPAAAAYRLWDEDGQPACGASVRVIRALYRGQREGVLGNLSNSLEEPVMRAYPEVRELKARMQEIGLVALMSGSGPCVYGVAANQKEAEQAAEALRPLYPWVAMARTLGPGRGPGHGGEA